MIWHSDARSNSRSIVFYPSCSTLNLIAHKLNPGDNVAKSPRGQAPEPPFQTVPVHCSQRHCPAFFAESLASTVHLLTVFCGGGFGGHHAPKRSALIYNLKWLKSVTQTARIMMWATVRCTVQVLGLYIFTCIFWCVQVVFRMFRPHHWIPGGHFAYIAYALREDIHCFGYARKRSVQGTSIVQPFS